jgi:hypothetical protein
MESKKRGPKRKPNPHLYERKVENIGDINCKHYWIATGEVKYYTLDNDFKELFSEFKCKLCGAICFEPSDMQRSPFVIYKRCPEVVNETPEIKNPIV